MKLKAISIVLLVLFVSGCNTGMSSELDTFETTARTPVEIHHPWLPQRAAYDAWIEGRTLFSHNETIAQGTASTDPPLLWSLSVIGDTVVWSFETSEATRLRGLRGEFELLGSRYIVYGWTDNSFIVIQEIDRFIVERDASMRSLELLSSDGNTVVLDNRGSEIRVTEGRLFTTRHDDSTNDSGWFFVDQISDDSVRLIEFARFIRIYDSSVDQSREPDVWESIDIFEVDFSASNGMFEHATLAYPYSGGTDPLFETFTITREDARVRADSLDTQVETRPGSVIVRLDRRGGYRLLFDSEFDERFTHRIRVIAR